jgi:hypothetical protein
MARAMPKAVVAGESLQSRLDSGERFGQVQLMSLLRGIGNALADAHRAGRFHGSITPADICFDSAGEIGLAGWGRDTTPDAMRASRYAPVECYAPVHPQGPWTDVYSLGAVAWCAITAEPLPEVLHRKGDVTLSRLAPAGFDPAFLASVDAALEIAPQRRPQTIERWLAMFGPVSRQPTIAADPRAGKSDAALATADGESQAAPEKATLPWPFRHIWPVAATAVAAVIGALWATSPPEPSPEPASSSPPASSETSAKAGPEPEPIVAAGANAAATEAPPPIEAVVAETPAAAPAPKPRPAAKTEAAAPAAKAPPPPPPAVVERAPEPEVAGGEAPRALLARADKRLRRLFGDYARLRADVEDSYDDNDVPYAVKRRAYREGLRIQRELVELRDARNRIARTGDFQAANRRYDAFEASAAQLSARMDDLRRDF